MKKILEILTGIIKIEVEGKNISNFIKKVITNNINIYSLNYISYNKANIIIDYKDYKKIIKNKTIYKIQIVDYYGRLKLLKNLKKNFILLISLMVGLVFLITLSNVIFDIEILHTNKNIIKIIKNELNNNDLKKYSFKKSYDEIEKIEEKILNNNKDTIEWIEIDLVGTKYVINVEQRKLNKEKKSVLYQHIVASKNAIINSIETSKGEKIKKTNEYVNKDEIIVSGMLNKTSGEIFYLKAIGNVKGIVWYRVSVEYPYTYKEELYTGNNKTVYVINFLNKRFSFFNFNKYETFNTNKKLLLKNNIIHLNFTKEKQYQIKITNEIYTDEEVKNKAINYAKEKILNSNTKIQEVRDIKILSQEYTESKIKLNLFISVLEDITKYQEIIP